MQGSRVYHGFGPRLHGLRKFACVVLDSNCRQRSVAPGLPHTSPFIGARQWSLLHKLSPPGGTSDVPESHSVPPRHSAEYRDNGTVAEGTDEAAASVIRKTGMLRQTLRSAEVRDTMRHVPHPVAIITSTDVSASPEGESSAWRGATVSSFNTVTLDPKPIVSFNIKKRSSTYEAVKNSGLFSVNLLDSTNASARIAHTFSIGNELSPFHHGDGSLARFAMNQPSASPSSSQEVPKIGREPPSISSHAQSQYSLRCEHLPDKDVEIADHVVVFGKVTKRLAELHGFAEAGVLLYYVNGEYKPMITSTNAGRVSSRPKTIVSI